MKQEFATPVDALAHFGVKGMKWGVRRISRKERKLIARRAVQKEGERRIAQWNAEKGAQKRDFKRIAKRGVIAVGAILAAVGAVAVVAAIGKSTNARAGQKALQESLSVPFQWKDSTGNWHRYEKKGGQWKTR